MYLSSKFAKLKMWAFIKHMHMWESSPLIREAWIHTDTCESTPHSLRNVIIMIAYVTKSLDGLISYFALTKAKASFLMLNYFH